MSKNKKALDVTVKTQLASLSIQVDSLTKERDQYKAENTALRKTNVQLATVIENDLKAEKIVNIMAMSDFKQSDLEDLKIEELQRIHETLIRGKSSDKTGATYKPIRAGDTSGSRGRTTVGSLFGKSRSEILAMGGDF